MTQFFGQCKLAQASADRHGRSSCASCRRLPELLRRQHEMPKDRPMNQACYPGAGHSRLGRGAGEHSMVWNLSTIMSQAGPARALAGADAQYAPDSARARLAAAKMALQYPERVERLESGLGWRIKPVPDPVRVGWMPPGPYAEQGAP